MAKKIKRDANGKVKDSLLERFRSWRLGKKLRKGIIPRGRTISEPEALKALNGGCKGVMTEVYGLLSAKHVCANGLQRNLGVISSKLITTAFRDYVVDSLQDSTNNALDVFHWHGSGTGNNAEANTQTALITEVETRANGNQGEGANGNIYKTVGTVTYTANRAVVEHGIFSANANGTMMDRSLFAAINVSANDTIEFTYQATFNAE